MRKYTEFNKSTSYWILQPRSSALNYTGKSGINTAHQQSEINTSHPQINPHPQSGINTAHLESGINSTHFQSVINQWHQYRSPANFASFFPHRILH